MKICQNCNHENNDTSNFCEACGTKLVGAPKFCPQCGEKLDGSPKFCPKCGFNLSENKANPETGTDDKYSYENDDLYEYKNDNDNSYLSIYNQDSNETSDSDDYEEYVNEDEYEEFETRCDKISKIVDKYISLINKDGIAYSSRAIKNEKYAQIIQNLRSVLGNNLDNDSEIIGFIDTSIMRKGKAGLVFTPYEIFEISSGAKWKLSYTVLQATNMIYTGKKIIFEDSSLFDCGIGWMSKGLDVQITNTWYNIPALYDCLKEIISIDE